MNSQNKSTLVPDNDLISKNTLLKLENLEEYKNSVNKDELDIHFLQFKRFRVKGMKFNEAKK